MKTIVLPGISQLQPLIAPIFKGSHFTWGEATKNGTRIPTDTEFEGNLITAAQITGNIIRVTKKLEEIREIFDNRPIIITSWYRDPESNRDVGGVRNSQHVLGWAVDFRVHGIDPNDVAAKLNQTWKGGLGDSEAFTHADMRQLLGWSIARWNYGFA